MHDNQLIKINNTGTKTLQTEIFSLQGKMIQKEVTPIGDSSFNLKSAPPGFYFVKIIAPRTQTFSTFKIVLL